MTLSYGTRSEIEWPASFRYFHFHCTVGRGGHLFAAMLQAGIVGLPNVGKAHSLTP